MPVWIHLMLLSFGWEHSSYPLSAWLGQACTRWVGIDKSNEVLWCWKIFCIIDGPVYKSNYRWCWWHVKNVQVQPNTSPLTIAPLVVSDYPHDTSPSSRIHHHGNEYRCRRRLGGAPPTWTGQWEVDWTQLLSVQVQVVSGPNLDRSSSIFDLQYIQVITHDLAGSCCLFPCHNHVPHISVSFSFIPLY